MEKQYFSKMRERNKTLDMMAELCKDIKKPAASKSEQPFSKAARKPAASVPLSQKLNENEIKIFLQGRLTTVPQTNYSEKPESAIEEGGSSDDRARRFSQENEVICEDTPNKVARARQD
jgi:hypothetical protein